MTRAGGSVATRSRVRADAGRRSTRLRIVRYYPRALVGDGGMTSAVKKWSQGFVNAGADAVIAYDEGTEIPAPGGVEWRRVRHAGRPRMKWPVGLADILRGADVLVLHSGWTVHNLRAA